MKWSQSETLALARHGCTRCLGIGTRASRGGKPAPCSCVYRTVFRACYGRFRYCANKEKSMSQACLEYRPGRERCFTWGRKAEEYVADFVLVSRRTLDAEEYKLFNFHFLLGADWKLCCQRLKLDRGNFFHAVYRIEQKLGKVFRELEPYSLFPVDEYFQDNLRRQPVVEQREVRPAGARLRYFRRALHAELARSA